MKYEPVTGVQPEIFRWARQSVGLSILDVAKMLKRRPEEIEAWETGGSTPTYPQLEKLAYQVYKRPLAVFFLPTPPDEVIPQREFRTLPDADMETLSRDTYLHIRQAHAYQIALKELFGGLNPAERRIWKELTLSLSQNVAAQAASIREFMGVTLKKQLEWRSDEHALKEWRKAIEDSGVFVFKAAFKQKDISGFCLMDENLPVIYLNNSTAKTRQIFSLLHELAHLLFGMNGLSKFDTSYFERLPKTEKRIEQFCNAIAAEVLIPEKDFSIEAKKLPFNVENVSEEQLSSIATRYGASREAILRRFLEQGRVSKVFYESKAKYWASQKKRTGGGNWYSNKGSYISERFSKEIISRHYRHQLTLEQAAEFLGIKPKSFAGFEQLILRGAGE